MAEKHTPGPWKANDVIPCVFAGAMKICDVRGWGHLTGRGGGLGLSEEKAIAIQTANALLIAAAPDLLAALKDCCAALGGVVANPDAIPASAIAALAKAEGGAGEP